MKLRLGVVAARRWQQEALDVWLRTRTGIVAVVTGAGKTIFGLYCFASLREQMSDARLVVVVPTLALMDQWAVALQEDLGLSPSEIATYSGEGRPPEPRLANVIVINTAREVMGDVTTNGSWMLIVDECHRAGTASNSNALRGNFVATLGLSATPEREFDLGFAAILEPILGPIIFKYDYERALNEGVISPFELINIEVPLTEDEAVEYARLTRYLASQNREHSERFEAIARKRANVAIMAKLRVPVALAFLRSDQAKCIVFHERISEAERIAQHLQNSERRPTTYHSQVAGNERRERLRLFRTGSFDTLITCRSLDEGLNVPDVALGVIVASSSSRRQRIQRLGRTLRVSDAAKIARVVTLYATPVEERRLAAEEETLRGTAGVKWIKAKLSA